MGRIRLLPDALASQVAAGEVVERPASVTKELIENSFDADATSVEVEFAKGGTALIRVTDDGRGMDPDDALLSLERHATSKLASEEDLFRVMTYGFRGEAVPSIASVSRFRLSTRPREAEAGTEILVSGGKVDSVRDSGRAPGTEIEVRSLFYNVPARRKFLRRESTEAAHIQQTINTLALARPQTGLTLIRDGTLVFRAAPTEDLAVRVRDLLGAAFLDRVRAIEPAEIRGVSIRGLVSKPGEGRPDRSQQYFFINGRAVQNPVLQGALREALEGTLPRNSSPLAILFMEIDPQQVDCNVHPAKREVRFRSPGIIREAVLEALQSGLRSPVSVQAAPETPAAPDLKLKPGYELHPPRQPELPHGEPSASARPLRRSESGADFAPEAPSPEKGQDVSPAPAEPSVHAPSDFREVDPAAADEMPFVFRGRLGERYLLFEDEQGLVVADVASIRKRILFEKILAAIREGNAPSQRLLLPTTVELPPKEHDWAVRHLEDLALVGFVVEPFGGNTLKIEAVPAHRQETSPEELFLELVHDLREGGRSAGARIARESLAAAVARSVSAASGEVSGSEADRLIADLMKCDMPYTSPEGRPTLLHYSFSEIARKFGRLPER